MKKKAFILYIDKDAIAAFWVLVTAGAILTGGIMTWRTAAAIANRPQYVVMQSPKILQYPPGMTQDVEHEMYENQTALIMQSVFNRGPHRLDDSKRCRKLVLDSAWNWLQSHVLERESKVFDKEQLHQKVELDSSKFVIRDAPKEHGILTYVEGQLLRTGVIREMVFNEVWDVHAQFLWVTNPNLREKGRIPVVCKTVFIQEIAAGSTKRAIPPAPSKPALQSPASPVAEESEAPTPAALVSPMSLGPTLSSPGPNSNSPTSPSYPAAPLPPTNP